MTKTSDIKERMKSGLGSGLKPKPATGLFGQPTYQKTPEIIPEEISKGVKAPKVDTPNLQGASAAEIEVFDFDQKVTVPMTFKQRDILQYIEKLCRNNKQKKEERITSNTVIRCLIDLLDDFDGDVSHVCSKDDLKIVFSKYLGKKYLKD